MAMLGTGSWGKELGGGSIDIDFNLLSGSWEVRVARFFCGLFIKNVSSGQFEGCGFGW